MARSKKRIDRTPFEVTITALNHDGRGVGEHENTPIYVRGALPNEQVLVELEAQNRSKKEAILLQVLNASPDRVEARCEHFGMCSGCVLQHLAEPKQVQTKQAILLQYFQNYGLVPTPQATSSEYLAPAAALPYPEILPALQGDHWEYRRKGRLSARYVNKKGKTLVGFREVDGRFVADVSHCHSIIPALGQKIATLAELVDQLQARESIPQIEFIAGDYLDSEEHFSEINDLNNHIQYGKVIALIIRHLEPLSAQDRALLINFALEHEFSIYLQSGGLDTIQALWPQNPALAFYLPEWKIKMDFQPFDFIQVNGKLNQKMIAQAIDLLELQPTDRVLDLFCGLGNFTLPVSKFVHEIVGVEGDQGLVNRAKHNADINRISNAEFYAADLTQDQHHATWIKQGFNKLLVDPPRSGAEEVLKQLPLESIPHIVYVSCNPETLARDADYLVNQCGYQLKKLGVMDMFPHTSHIESMAVFIRP